MGIRKSIEEAFVVAGARDEWLTKCESALQAGGFTKLVVNPTLFQLSGDYKKLMTWGTLQLTLLPEGAGSTRIQATATANVDNVYALFKSPGQKILSQFKAAL